MALVGVIAGSYLIEMLLGTPDWEQIGYHALTPQFTDTQSVLLATATGDFGSAIAAPVGRQ